MFDNIVKKELRQRCLAKKWKITFRWRCNSTNPTLFNKCIGARHTGSCKFYCTITHTGGSSIFKEVTEVVREIFPNAYATSGCTNEGSNITFRLNNTDKSLVF
jgi:hypothetical protein